MIHVNEVLVVEGKYDRIRLSAVTDALIFTTDGFGIFRQPERLALLRRLATDRGVVILTDSDSAGLVIRNYLSGALPGVTIKQAYIPPVFGKEKRKASPSREGLLGVEGMEPAVLERALRQAGVETHELSSAGWLTSARLYADGLLGRPDSAARRKALLQRLELPLTLSTNRLREVLSVTLTEETYQQLLQEMFG